MSRNIHEDHNYHADYQEFEQELALEKSGGVSTNDPGPLTPIEHLQSILADGTFHHATYRNIGTLWEGLWFYIKDPKGFRGYSVAGCIYKSSPDLDLAHKLTAKTGISVGSYGKG